jgi:hypothetical protein
LVRQSVPVQVVTDSQLLLGHPLLYTMDDPTDFVFDSESYDMMRNDDEVTTFLSQLMWSTPFDVSFGLDRWVSKTATDSCGVGIF